MQHIRDEGIRSLICKHLLRGRAAQAGLDSLGPGCRTAAMSLLPPPTSPILPTGVSASVIERMPAERARATRLQQPQVSHFGLRKAFRHMHMYMFVYTPIYRCNYTDFLINFAPTLTFFQSLVYQADEEIEEAQRGSRPFADLAPWVARYEILRSALSDLGLLDPMMTRLLDCISEYWQLENQLNYHHVVNRETVQRAIRLRSCDVHAGNYICLSIGKISNREAIFDALSLHDNILDLKGDLSEYADDVAENSYNTYRMFVRLYGSSAADYMQEELTRYYEMMHKKIALLPATDQTNFQQALAIAEDLYPMPDIPAPIIEPVG